MTEPTIHDLRAQLDVLDERLVGLLNERAELSLAIRALKEDIHTGIYDPKREAEIMAHVSASNAGPLYADQLHEIYATILQVMKEARS
jgi:chorismate mutase/prephenate dehydratase